LLEKIEKEMNMPFGYNGKILHVDLTNKSTTIENPGENFYRKYIGGSALGMYYLLKRTPQNADPLGPENVLVFADSILTGVPIAGLSRITVTAKSPLTGLAGDSQSGGFFPAELKFAGFDAVVIKGKADSPVYLSIINGKAELRSAQKLWGKITKEVESLIREELQDDRVQIIQCGIAGENAVLFASILSMSNRVNGRNGMGAVMASKNLKAIAVRGKRKPEIADPKRLNEIAKWGTEEFSHSDIYELGVLGTPSVVEPQNSVGGLPAYNWRSGHFENYAPLDGKAMEKTILKGRDTCYACIVRCKRVVEIVDEKYPVDPYYGGPEYETIATLGSLCGIDDLEAVSYANQLCNMYGLDTMSCGGTIAWAMDCYENGLITKEDTGGLDLSYGNIDAIRTLPKLIATRQGFGDVLADGSARASKIIGKGSEKLLVTVKNQEYPAHMPQVKHSLALIYAVNPFGADHQSSEHDPGYIDYPERMAEIGLMDPQPETILNEEKARFTFITQCAFAFMDSVNACQFVYGPSFQLFGMKDLAEIVSVVTGWDFSVKELLEVGERRINMMRFFNAREGVGRELDTLPEKIQQPLLGGESDGYSVTLDAVEQAKDWYYEMAGWDIRTGNPDDAKLKQLGLEWAVHEAE
jgi:aldehyde:ferredoxin oxidoreductase